MNFFDSKRYDADCELYERLVKDLVKDKHWSRDKAIDYLSKHPYPAYHPDPNDYYEESN